MHKLVKIIKILGSSQIYWLPSKFNMNDLKALYPYQKTPINWKKCRYNIILKISLQRKAYNEKARRYQLHCIKVLPAKELGTRCKLEKFNVSYSKSPSIINSMLVGKAGSVSYMPSGFA